VTELRATIPAARFARLAHPSASVSSFATIGEGAVILQNAAVCANAVISAHCIVNTAAVAEHDTVMEDFSSLAPAAVTGGNCHIGARAAICIGAVVRHGVRIGEDAVLGANAYAHEDIPARTLAVGTPARVIRNRDKSDPYL
jgi:acetyltransferase-like isoleucine patch superfamily enzyme